MTEPWWSWPERWRIAEEYHVHHATLRELAHRYHHSRDTISAWLCSLGLIRSGHREREGRKIRRITTPALRELATWLVRAQNILGHVPNEEQIGNIIMEIREYNGGITKIRKGCAADD